MMTVHHNVYIKILEIQLRSKGTTRTILGTQIKNVAISHRKNKTKQSTQTSISRDPFIVSWRGETWRFVTDGIKKKEEATNQFTHLCDVSQEGAGGGDAGSAAPDTDLPWIHSYWKKRDPTVVHCYIFHVVMTTYHRQKCSGRDGCVAWSVFHTQKKTNTNNLCCINIKSFTYSSSCQVTD